jgi:RNA polymerase sigma factor (TIGR02999 family)
MTSTPQLTKLLARIQEGDASARDELFASAYPELRRIARSRLRSGGRSVVMDTTALVHESYLRFAHGGRLKASDRRAFFAYASQIMRSVIVNSIREHTAQKRTSPTQSLTLALPDEMGIDGDESTILQVHELLEDLSRTQARLVQIAQMRYFGGYTEQEVAEYLGISKRTVAREWEEARLILAKELQG